MLLIKTSRAPNGAKRGIGPWAFPGLDMSSSGLLKKVDADNEKKKIFNL